MLSLVFPTRGRPAIFADAIANLRRTVVAPADVQVVVGIDEGDPYKSENVKAAMSGLVDSGTFCRSRVVVGTWPTMQAKMVELYSRAEGAGVLFFADDCRWEQAGWDEQLRTAAAGLPKGIGVISVNDLLHSCREDFLRENGVPGNFLITRAWADVLGYWWPPGFSWSAQDTWVWDLARRVDAEVPGVRVLLEGVRCRHYHKRLRDLCFEYGLPMPDPEVAATYASASATYNDDVYGLDGYVARTTERIRDAEKLLVALRG